MSTFYSDIRCGVRQLIKSPGLSVLAVLILALGIGTCATMFGFVNTFLLSRLPFDDAERLVALQASNTRSGNPCCVSFPDFLDWQEQNRSLEAMAFYQMDNATLSVSGTPEKIKVTHVTADLLPILGVRPAAGRLFTPQDDQPQAPMTALLSHGLWQRRFGSQPDVVGQAIELDGQSATVIGVLPAGFVFPTWSRDQGELWQPLRPWMERPDHRWLLVRGASGNSGSIGKLKPGVTIAQARADMDVIARQLEQKYPESNRDSGVYLTGLRDHMVRTLKPVILLLTGAVALVLLIVCANTANFLLLRSAERIQEFSVRSALGAGQWHIVRQIVCQSLVLVTVGGFVGILLALAGNKLLFALFPAHLQSREVAFMLLRSYSLLFTLGLIVATALVSSLASVLHICRSNLTGQIRSQHRTTTNRRGHRLRDSLVVAEIALALILLVGAGLLLNSFIHYMRTDRGFDPDHVVALRLSLPDQAERRESFCRQLLDQVDALPGVKYAGLSSGLLDRYLSTSCYTVEGAPAPELGQHFWVHYFDVTPEFFQAMGMRLVQGRYFTEWDTNDDIVIVDQAFVEKWWPDEDPIGRHINFFDGRKEVIGVVGHVKQRGVDKECYPCLYQTGHRVWSVSFDRSLVVRTQTNPTDIVAPIRQIITQLDATVPIFEIQTVHQIMNDQSRLRRVSAGVLGGFAFIALLLSALGIYGIMAYAVVQRTQEIGIRMALGARAWDVLRIILAHGSKLTIMGVSLGLLGTIALGGLIRHYLFGVTAHDPITFLCVIAVLVAAALLACYVPARRAARIDPMVALRCE